MGVKYQIYLMKDSQGNKASVTVEEIYDTAQILGMKDKEGYPIYFKNKAYYISGFCKNNNIELKVIYKTYDFDTLWNT